MSSIRILSGSDVDELTKSLSADSLIKMLGSTMNKITTAGVGRSYREFPDPAQVQNPLRISTESSQHKILYMPSRLYEVNSIKIVSVPNSNASEITKEAGLPATTLLIDDNTGTIKAVINAGELTGIRTAAASALATKILADSDSQRLVIFGTGTQAFYHSKLILELFPSIIQVHFIGRSFDNRAKDLLVKVKSTLNTKRLKLCKIEWISKPFEEILRQADIVCTCVPSLKPLFEPTDLKSSVHINAIGSYTPEMFEFPPSLISRLCAISEPGNQPFLDQITTILVDSISGVLSEAGELIEARTAIENLIEIGELVDCDGNLKVTEWEKKKSLRESGRSLFKCVGVGGMDSAIANLVFDKAVELNIGTLVDY